MALTPAARHLGLQVSPLISLRFPNVPPPTTRVARMSFCSLPFNAYGVFQASPFPSKLAANTPPNRVRFTADRQFVSSCSPPHLAVTQLLSTTGPWLTLTRTLTVLTQRLYGRTRDGNYFPPPAQIPACGFPAPGSSRRSNVTDSPHDAHEPVRERGPRWSDRVRR